MGSEEDQRLPGLYRIWDLQFVFDRRNEYRVQYSGQTDDGTPLFMVFRRPIDQERMQ